MIICCRGRDLPRVGGARLGRCTGLRRVGTVPVGYTCDRLCMPMMRWQDGAVHGQDDKQTPTYLGTYLIKH